MKLQLKKIDKEEDTYLGFDLGTAKLELRPLLCSCQSSLMVTSLLRPHARSSAIEQMSRAEGDEGDES